MNKQKQKQHFEATHGLLDMCLPTKYIKSYYAYDDRWYVMFYAQMFYFA